MAAMVECTCANEKCRKKFKAKAADRKRGWGLFCSKSCKAVRQEARTGQYARFLRSESSVSSSLQDRIEDSVHPFSDEALGQWEDS